MSTWKVSEIAVVSKAKSHENAKARVVQHLRTEGRTSDGKLVVSCQEMANVVNCTVDAARQVLKGLAREEGSGVHEVSPSVFEYRVGEVSDGRKTPDRQATFKVHDHMLRQTPYTPHPVAEICRELGMPNGTVSGSLNRLIKDPATGVHKDYQGVYSYRPDQTPQAQAAAEVRAASNGSGRVSRIPLEEIDMAAAQAARDDDLMQNTERTLEGAEALEAAVALLRSERSDKIFRQRAVVGGIILVQDDDGNLYPLGERL